MSHEPYDYSDPATRAKVRACADLLGEPAATELRAALDVIDRLEAEVLTLEATLAELEEVRGRLPWLARPRDGGEP